eukprot:Em0005g1117a
MQFESNMSKCQRYDLIVVGGGPMGLATAYNAAKAGKKVLILERFTLFNQSGSSNDMVRMFRTMYTEDFMADLAKESIQLWRDLEAEAGVDLIMLTGLLNFGDPDYVDGPEGNLLGPIKNLERLGMKYEKLSSEDIMKEMPFKDLPSSYVGLWAPDNGCINVSLTLRVLYELGQNHGVEVLQNATVKLLEVIKDRDIQVAVEIGSSGNKTMEILLADKCVITAGAYVNDILEPSFNLKLNLDIWEMTSAYYACDPFLVYEKSTDSKIPFKGLPFKCMWFQFEKEDNDDWRESNLFYGFPQVPWGPPNLSRIAVDNAVRRIKNPDQRKPLPAPHCIDRTSKFIKERVVGVINQPTFSAACLQTNLPDNMFVLDYMPNCSKVAVFTGGWGFKMIPLIGRILKEMLFDPNGTQYDISHFKITRRVDGKKILVPAR